MFSLIYSLIKIYDYGGSIVKIFVFSCKINKLFKILLRRINCIGGYRK